MFVPRRPLALLLATSFTLAVPLLAHAQVWNESPDAGSLVSTAQITVGSGSLAQINGNLDTPDDVDLFCIDLTSSPPSGAALLQLLCVAISGPNLYLFDSNGYGVYETSLCSGGGKTIAQPSAPLPAGLYYVGVSYSGIEPQSAGGAIWSTSTILQHAPDGPGAAQPLLGWSGTPNVQPINPYQIGLQGFSYCSGVTPTTKSTWGTLKTHYR